MVLDEDDSMIDTALKADIGCCRVFVATPGFTLIVKCGIEGPASSSMLQTLWTEFEELAVTYCEHTGIEGDDIRNAGDEIEVENRVKPECLMRCLPVEISFGAIDGQSGA